MPRQPRKPRAPRDPNRRRSTGRLKATVVGKRDDGRQVIESKRPGKCDRCERWYPTGEFLVYDKELATWVHDGCLPLS